jgi:hypothetical protein
MNEPASTPTPTHTQEIVMNTQPAQPISRNGRQATTPINTNQLADIAELLDILDGFLRHAHDIANRLADYLHTTGRDHPQLPDGASYNANLLIDQVSFTAHALRVHRREPLE